MQSAHNFCHRARVVIRRHSARPPTRARVCGLATRLPVSDESLPTPCVRSIDGTASIGFKNCQDEGELLGQSNIAACLTALAVAAASLHTAASAALLFPVPWPCRQQEEWEPALLIFFFLGFYFPSDIDEMVPAMACWNKVFPVSPYLEDVSFGVDEGPVRVVSPNMLVPFRS